MFGITPMPIYDPTQTTSYLTDFMVFFRPGDIVKWKPIDWAEYDRTVAQVEQGTYRPRICDVVFSLDEFNQDNQATTARLLEALYDS